MGKDTGPPGLEKCEFPELRAWYEDIHWRLEHEPALSPGEVLASWARVARPVARGVVMPSKAERRRSPRRYVRTEGQRYLSVVGEDPRPLAYDGPMETPPDKVLSVDRAGMYLRVGGSTLRDREQALQDLRDGELASRLVDAFMASGRQRGARKGVHPEMIARALLLWSLRDLGHRRAARCVIVWDDELATPFADHALADVVRRSQEHEEVSGEERDRRVSAEAALITASRRVWRTVGLLDQPSMRI